MSWEETLAICYLQQVNDEKNKCSLTDKHFIVIYRGKASHFSLEQIREICFNQRRWLLPLVAGGIAGPFALLAIFLNLYNPWPMFILLVASSLTFYFGWQQYAVLTVRDGVKEHDFPLRYISSNLRAFVNFVNHHLQHKDEMIYHIARTEDWQQAQQQKIYKTTSLERTSFIHASTKDQWHRLKKSKVFSPEESWVLLTIDPLKVQAEICYEQGDDPPGFQSDPHELFPHIYGPLNLDAIVKAEHLNPNF